MEKNMERELTITKTITFSHVRGTITARAFRLDEGAVILVTGGTRTHVGAFSRAVPGQETMTIQFPGHRDGVISGHWAEEISRLLKEPVTVECGIHFDDLSGDESQMILGLCGEMLESLCRCWNP